MGLPFETTYRRLRTWSRSHGIPVRKTPMQPGKAGQFNGVHVTMNSNYSSEERTYYLAHALGSIVRWSLSTSEVQALFDELRDAKKDKTDPERLEKAIERYRAFETESSEYAVWLLAELKREDAIPSYTNFMRADLEALTEFHRKGKAPVWRDFFARWNEEVARGERPVLPYTPKPVPAFTPIAIEKQEILQEQGGA